LPPFQFSLKWLMIVVTAVAVVMAFGVVFDTIITWILKPLLSFALPAALLSAAVFGRGDTRAFAGGALVPCVYWMVEGTAPVSLNGAWLGVAVWLLLWCGISGVVALATRRWIVRRGLGPQDRG
jgi:hypothetical protein